MEHLQSLTAKMRSTRWAQNAEVSSSERLQDPSEGQDEFEDDHVEGDGAGEVTTGSPSLMGWRSTQRWSLVGENENNKMKRWCSTAYRNLWSATIYSTAWQPQLPGTPGEDEGLQSFGFNEKSGRIEMMVVMAPDAWSKPQKPLKKGMAIAGSKARQVYIYPLVN